ncbi:MAG: hypothetical protein ACFFCV_03055 [Promethearchaeota archaeon]
MGLEVINSKIQIIRNEIDVLEESYNVSNLIIPFSIIFNKDTPLDIYSGKEKIPFKEKVSEFQEILISEFGITNKD